MKVIVIDLILDVGYVVIDTKYFINLVTRVGEDDDRSQTRPLQLVEKPEFYVRTVYDW